MPMPDIFIASFQKNGVTGEYMQLHTYSYLMCTLGSDQWMIGGEFWRKT